MHDDTICMDWLKPNIYLETEISNQCNLQIMSNKGVHKILTKLSISKTSLLHTRQFPEG